MTKTPRSGRHGYEYGLTDEQLEGLKVNQSKNISKEVFVKTPRSAEDIARNVVKEWQGCWYTADNYSPSAHDDLVGSIAAAIRAEREQAVVSEDPIINWADFDVYDERGVLIEKGRKSQRTNSATWPDYSEQIASAVSAATTAQRLLYESENAELKAKLAIAVECLTEISKMNGYGECIGQDMVEMCCESLSKLEKT